MVLSVKSHRANSARFSLPSAFKIGTGARSEGRSERESGFAGKLAGSGFGQYAVIARLEEFG